MSQSVKQARIPAGTPGTAVGYGGGVVARLKPFRPYGSELDIEFINLVRLLPGSCNPRMHLRQAHDRLATGGRNVIQLRVIGHKPGLI